MNLSLYSNYSQLDENSLIMDYNNFCNHFPHKEFCFYSDFYFHQILRNIHFFITFKAYYLKTLYSSLVNLQIYSQIILSSTSIKNDYLIYY
jgi:hypothetical protein